MDRLNIYSCTANLEFCNSRYIQSERDHQLRNSFIGYSFTVNFNQTLNIHLPVQLSKFKKLKIEMRNPNPLVLFRYSSHGKPTNMKLIIKHFYSLIYLI